MKLIGPRDAFGPAMKGSVAAIGNFDGLHRGHQQLLAVAADIAKTKGASCGILTFEPHPRTFFRPEEPVFRLTPLRLKARLAQGLGVDFLAWLDFNHELAALSPEDFVAHHLVGRIAVSHVVTGYDFHFGKGRKGGPDTLRAMGAELGFGVTIVEQVTDDGDGHAPFASSSIRSSLRRGHVRAAAHELGYLWTVMGTVVHGDKRGRTIGFPTANIVVDPGAEPFRGIYAVEVRDAEAAPGTHSWAGAAYFGDRPTFNTNRTFLEVHLLDQERDLYGRELVVSFVELVRPDKTFSSVEALVGQMKVDCEDARRVIEAWRNADHEYPLARLQAKGQV